MASTGRMIAEDGSVVNIADILGGYNTGKRANIEQYAPHSGEFISESGDIINIAKRIGAGGGGSGSGSTISVTAKKEGKTTIAANLALALAQRKKKVLLIEGDLQKMDLAALMGVEVPDEMGISKNLNRQTDLKSLVYKTDELPVSLLVNKAPHNRSAEFLGSRRFAEFLNVMREEMDFIIIDGPAVKGRADAEVLARRSDASLLVVKQNDLKVQFINDTIDILNHYGKGVLGCVLNHAVSGLSVFTSGYGYGYGSYRYGGYYGYGKYGYGYGYGKYGSYYSRQHEKAKRDKEKEDRRKEKEE